MQTSPAILIFIVIAISTCLILVFGSIIVRYIFLYQRKRYRHEQEKLKMKETFNNILMQSKFEIQEQTLNHISKEIHDHFSPGLLAVKTMIRTAGTQSFEKAKEKMSGALQHIQELYDQMRALSLSLNTEKLMRLGFRQSLQNELNRMAKTGDYQTTLSVKGQELYMEPDKTTILFRICQEALNNTLKHADAKSIDIVIDYAADPVTLTISDNGKGFDNEKVLLDAQKQESTGLQSMMSRAQQIDASLEVKSMPGKGTKTIISIHHLKNETYANTSKN